MRLLPMTTTLRHRIHLQPSRQAALHDRRTGQHAICSLAGWRSRTKGSAGQHTEVGQEALYANLPGIKVVVPSNAYDAKGLLIAAIRNPDPVVYFDYPEVKSGEQPDVPDDAYEVPLGKAAVRQPGKDITLVAWAPATVEVKQALPLIAKDGISVEYIDPRTLKPLDVDTLVASVKKTKRLLVVEHGHYTNSYGSHVIAEVVQAVPGAKARKIAFPDVPGPGCRRDDGVAAPGRAKDRGCRQADHASLSGVPLRSSASPGLGHSSLPNRRLGRLLKNSGGCHSEARRFLPG